MADSIIERAARAVEGITGTHCPSCEAQLHGDPEDIVRAVLGAMREPSKGMVEAAYGVINEGYSSSTMAVFTWHEMLDAALQDD